MATITRDYIAPRYGMVPVLANATPDKGEALGSSGGYGRELTAGDGFMGFAEEQCDATGESSGAIEIRAIVGGRVTIPVVGASVTSVGAAVYASGSNAFTLTSASNSRIGKVLQWISGTTCLVEFAADGASQV